MRKFLFLFVAVLLMGTVIGCTQCSNDAPWGIEYSLQSNGKTDANVNVAFINGDFYVEGDANYDFSWTNAKVPEKLSVGQYMDLNRALEANDANVLEAAQYVNNWLDDQIKITSFEGHYDIYVKGYVKETKTQITFSIDRHFTNYGE